MEILMLRPFKQLHLSIKYLFYKNLGSFRNEA